MNAKKYTKRLCTICTQTLHALKKNAMLVRQQKWCHGVATAEEEEDAVKNVFTSGKYATTLATSRLVHTSTSVLHQGILMEVCNLKQFYEKVLF